MKNQTLTNQYQYWASIPLQRNKERFESLAEAERNGYANISLILSEEYNRSQSGSLRWFRADTFDPNNIPPLEIPNAKRLLRGEKSTLSLNDEAEIYENFDFSRSKQDFNSVDLIVTEDTLQGLREYSQLTTEEILNQNEQDFINYIPPKNAIL